MNNDELKSRQPIHENYTTTYINFYSFFNFAYICLKVQRVVAQKYTLKL